MLCSGKLTSEQYSFVDLQNDSLLAAKSQLLLGRVHVVKMRLTVSTTAEIIII